MSTEIKVKRVAVVTGGSRGIGLETCLQLRDMDFEVVTCSSLSHGQCSPYSPTNPISSGIEFVQCDISRPEEVDAFFDMIERKYGRIDVLVNNAGILRVAPFAEATLEDMAKSMQTNVLGTLHCTQRAIHMMKKQPHDAQRIMNVLSSSLDGGRPNQAMYVASKAALAGAMKCIRLELADAIKIIDIIPRRTLTDMRIQNFPDEEHDDCLDPKEVARAMVALVALHDVTELVIR